MIIRATSTGIPVRIFSVLIALTLFSCSDERLDDYNDLALELVDQNGEKLLFPEDLHGGPVLMGFIYTNCPDICSFITANLFEVWEEMDHPEEVRFVLVTFDPERDRPDALKEYASAFDMDREPFRFLTGEPEVIQQLTERLGVRTQVSYTRESDEGEELYFLNHTDKIILIDERGRLVLNYGGSMTPTGIFVEDLENLL